MAIFQPEISGSPLTKDAKNRTVSPLDAKLRQNTGRFLCQTQPTSGWLGKRAD
jgi:hypothetical protein